MEDEDKKVYNQSWDAFMDAYLEQKARIEAQDRLLSKMVRLKANSRFVKEYKEISGQDIGEGSD